MNQFEEDKITAAWGTIIQSLGINPDHPDFKETPLRITKMYKEIFAGLLDGELSELEQHITKTFPSTYGGIVAVKNIKVWGTCPHHFLPVEYFVDVGYVPHDKVLGLSKLPRVVELLSSRPVLQEQLTKDIVNYLEEFLQPQGVIVKVRGRHHCMIIRGIKSHESSAITSSITGIFEHTPSVKDEFYAL